MPESETSLEGDQMLWNHKELVIFGKAWNLFEELSCLDKDVDCSFGQIVNFHFNIKHSNPFDKAFQNLDKTVGGMGYLQHDQRNSRSC